MTIDEAKRRLVNWCNSQIGYHEGANNWNKFAQELDKIDGLTWGAKQNQPWCGEFVLDAFVANFGVKLGLELQYSPMPTGIPLCRTAASYFQTAGQFVHSPQMGDVVFFIVNGEINHTGIVTNVGMGAITTVEGNSGNSSDMVARRTYDVISPKIAGFGRPNWALVESYNPDSEDDSEADPVTPDPIEPDPEPQRPAYLYHTYQYSVRINLLKIGDYGPQVWNMKAMLRSHGYECSQSDSFDDGTYVALMEFQKDMGIKADGEFGGDTFSKLYNFGGHKDETQ